MQSSSHAPNLSRGAESGAGQMLPSRRRAGKRFQLAEGAGIIARRAVASTRKSSESKLQLVFVVETT
jgi:hypothetical protein